MILVAVLLSLSHENIVAQILADPVTHPVIAVPEGDYCEHEPWHLVFADEFDGDSLDRNVWLTYSPDCWVQDECLFSRTHDWPNELQIFRDENVALSGHGTVDITARKGPLASWYAATSIYTSGLLISKNRFGRGRFECRCKVPKSTSQYLWPSFWLWGHRPNCSEIDILEILWKQANAYHYALHRYNYECDGNHANDEGSQQLIDLSDDFHVYRADWDKWFVNFYVDDALIYRACRIYDLLDRPVSSCEVGTGVYMQNEAFPAQDAEVSIIMGLGLHRAWPAQALGAGPEIPDLPATMEIDYVRVYQR